MTDTFSKQKRSEIMSRIRSSNTRQEELVFKYLQGKKIYFQKHYKRVPGNPDIALPRKKKAVFIDGDFWHGWKFKERAIKLPKEYWQEKIGNNIKRDSKNRRELRHKGWRILRIWEHQLKKKEQQTLEKIMNFLISE